MKNRNKEYIYDLLSALAVGCLIAVATGPVLGDSVNPDRTGNSATDTLAPNTSNATTPKVATIEAVDQSQNTLQIRDVQGNVSMLTVSPKATFRIGDRKGTLSDFHAGDQVSITVEKNGQVKKLQKQNDIDKMGGTPPTERTY